MTKGDENLTFPFVSEGIESVVEQATAAAGDLGVEVVGGASICRQLMQAVWSTPFRVDVMPELLGAGLPLFASGGLENIRLEKIGVQEVGPRTSLRFRFKK